MRSRTIVLAGGGTAGHIQPALAVAREWKRNHPQDRIVFLGTESGLEKTLVPAAGFELALITRVRVPRSISLGWLKVPSTLRTSIAETRSILADADLLIGFGGYVCAPAYLAAHGLHLPIVIHEANAKPGWANRLGARYTDALAVGSPVSDGPFSQALITGLPLRADIVDVLETNRDAGQEQWQAMRQSAKVSLGMDPDQKMILIFGGSQGSQALNAVIESARDALSARHIGVLHSVGGSNALPQSHGSYRALSYIENMAQAYLAADLIIARSGAITCSEVAAIGKYALFIPLPVGNGEQMVNADQLVRAGRAQVFSQQLLTSTWLLDNIDSMLTRSAQLGDIGDSTDLQAAAKIVALGEHQLEKSSR